MTPALAARASTALRWFAAEGAGALPHTGRTLADHLRGTYDVLVAWGQPERVCLAAVAHSVYSTDAFPDAVVGLDERERVRALIGAEAEELVYLYCTADRPAARDAAAAGGELPRIVDRRDGTVRPVPAAAVGDLAVLNLANLAEQGGHAELPPGHWVAAASRWGALARRWAEAVPPVLDDCRATVTEDEEQALLVAYRAGDFRGAASAVPWVGEPCVLLGRELGDADLCRRGAALLRRWATPWDKGRDLRFWLGLAGADADSGEGPAPASPDVRPRPLAHKLGLGPDRRLVLVDAPAGWSVPDQPAGLSVVRRLPREGRDGDVVVAFCRSMRDLHRREADLTARLGPTGALWVAWPRRAAGHNSDLTDQSIRAELLPLGLVDVKVAALGPDWSGLRFVWRKERRARH